MEESNALVPAAPQTLSKRWDGHLSQAEKDMLQRAVPGGNADEIELFVKTARAMGLHPLIGGYIFAIKRWNSLLQREVMSIQVGIGGYRVCAYWTGELEGRLGPFWCDRDGQWRDVWLSDYPPAAARVGVRRRGFHEPVWAVALYNESVQTKKKSTDPTPQWEKMPALMLAKCAEAQALRAAFPDQLSGTYTPDEMGTVETAGQVIEGEYADTAAELDSRHKQAIEAAHKLAETRFDTPETFAAWLLERKYVLEDMSRGQLVAVYKEIQGLAEVGASATKRSTLPTQGEPSEKDRALAAFWVTVADRWNFETNAQARQQVAYYWLDQEHAAPYDKGKGRVSLSAATPAAVRAATEKLKSLTPNAVEDYHTAWLQVEAGSKKAGF